jgi:peptidyl-prolyl cis-trans isomerase D
VQVEERQSAHTQALNEVLPAIQAALVRQNSAKAEQDYAQALTSEAIKNGLGKTAAAHHLGMATTPLLGEQGVISALADSSQILAKAFASKQGDPPQFASTGEGYAIFQVTGIAPAHAPNLAEYKSKIADDYRNELLPGLLSQKTAELAGKAKSLNDLAKAAQQVGATVKSSDLVGETGQAPDLGQVGQVAQRTDQRGQNRRGGQAGGQTGAPRRRDRQKLRPDPRPVPRAAPLRSLQRLPEQPPQRLQKAQPHPDSQGEKRRGSGHLSGKRTGNHPKGPHSLTGCGLFCARQLFWKRAVWALRAIKNARLHKLQADFSISCRQRR